MNSSRKNPSSINSMDFYEELTRFFPKIKRALHEYPYGG